MIKGVWESVGLGVGGRLGELVSGLWFVKIRGGTIGWFVVCMGNGVQDKFVMAHGKENGRWELRSLIKHDELRDMGHLVPMNKEAY
jgi:hypothetical protein